MVYVTESVTVNLIHDDIGGRGNKNLVSGNPGESTAKSRPLSDRVSDRFASPGASHINHEITSL